jgi:DNA-binding LacI/PurR family transcriptional regulator
MTGKEDRAPNIRDVARVAGVSHQTVSRVLNDHPSIRPETRDRVKASMAELNFRPNPNARRLVTRRSGMIGVLTSHLSNYGPATSIQALESAARGEGYLVTVTNIASTREPDIRSALDHLMGQSVEGLVVVAPQVSVFDVIRDMSIDVPLVSLEQSHSPARHGAWVDQETGARAAVRHLVDLGHEDIIHIAGPQNWIEAESRMQGYIRELDRADLSVRAPILGDWTASFGYRAGRELLRMRDFTALFAGNDQMALGFVHACRDAAVRVPEDVSVIGFDDIPEAEHFYPRLTTMRQDFCEVARRAVASLLSQLGGDRPEDADPIVPELIVRDSTSVAIPT